MEEMLLSVVIPLYNEEEVVGLLMERLLKVMDTLPVDAEVVFVNDGSTDGTLELLLGYAEERKQVKVLDLSRNFGHQMAITAGLDFADGEIIILMDGDLQDPPELIPQMFEMANQGFDIIYAKRRSRKGESIFKRTTSYLFYWLIRQMTSLNIPADTGDFRCLSRRAADALTKLREQHRFVRGMSTWVGFRQTEILFDRQPRIAGKTHFTFTKMFLFALDSIFSFSAKPLRFVTVLGLITLAGGSLYMIYNLYLHFFLNLTVPGWTSIIVLQIGFSGTILIALGVLGEYVARIFEESKNRPLYIVKNAYNLKPYPEKTARLSLQESENDSRD
jgi:glycosyltransferase involved in cell wall biosynthesis